MVSHGQRLSVLKPAALPGDECPPGWTLVLVWSRTVFAIFPPRRLNASSAKQGSDGPKKDPSGSVAIGGFSPETLSRLSISFFALFGAFLSAAAIGDGRPASASVLLTFLGAGSQGRLGAQPDENHVL